jgi:hypothetical protein
MLAIVLFRLSLFLGQEPDLHFASSFTSSSSILQYQTVLVTNLFLISALNAQTCCNLSLEL